MFAAVKTTVVEKNSPGNGVSAGIARSSRYIFPGLLLLTLLAYCSVFSAGYIWDDDAYVLNNQCLRSLDGLYRIWFEPGATPQYYPLVFTLFWVQFKLWGLAPFGYHLVNILLHGFNAILLYRVLQKLDIPSPIWIAAIFALHPVQVESVAWITELKNVLSTFFYLVSFLLYWQCREGAKAQSRLLYVASLLAFLLALFSKSVTGSLPAVILLLIWWKGEKIFWRDVARLIPYFALALILGWNTARLEVSHVLASGAEWDFTFIERVLIAGRAICFYAAKLLWPYPLIFNYARWQIDATAWWQYLFPLGVVMITVGLWALRNKTGRGVLAGWLFFMGTLFPALGFFNVYPMRYSFVADHFQYLASIGLITLLTAGFAQVLRRQRWGAVNAELPVFLPLLVLFGALTWQQGQVYHDRMSLFTDTIEKNPRSWLGYSNRGRDYALAGRDDLALADLEKSLAINPADADALQVRGVIALKNKDFARALQDMERSVALYPLRSDYLRNRCLAYRSAGRLDLAITDAARLIELAPDEADAYLLRASLLVMAGNRTAARSDLEAVIRLGQPLTAAEVEQLLGPDRNGGGVD